MRIRYELGQRGVTGSLLESGLDDADPAWRRRAAAARAKRFGGPMPGSLAERARQVRFLERRGFTAAQIRGAFSEEGDAE